VIRATKKRFYEEKCWLGRNEQRRIVTAHQRRQLVFGWAFADVASATSRAERP
jgi:hypothetical protein